MIEPTLQTIAAYAEKALLYEVSLSPKPGLVDRLTNGAHQDMDYDTFIDSITGLRPFFMRYLQAGFKHHGTMPQLFTQLRQIGIEAEAAMLKATAGINTHKGANFSFAILLGATGYYLQQSSALIFSPEDSQTIVQLASEMTKALVEKDFQQLPAKNNLSYGEKLYLEYGLTGIRGEAAAGYPSLIELSLPYLRKRSQEATEIRLLRTLIYLMSEVEDGNLLHRGGYQMWQLVQMECKKIHQEKLPAEEFLDELTRYDRLLIQRNLSPGGSADLLALSIFFGFLEELFYSPSGMNVYPMPQTVFK
ncbi:triphosphoribosyl-dephospho-CoA synthase CitG [Enterococcus malodoratus]|uniref:triphosphoribosyl-dephospho-CoA synthase CitG n=1 Tax=Enterococcus malodoratus TaxID=71451 RepID=UPI0039AEA9D2